MAQLVRTGPTSQVPGVGHARRGVIHTVPDDLVSDLLASGEWATPPGAVVERVTEPAPSTPAAPTRASRAKTKK